MDEQVAGYADRPMQTPDRRTHVTGEISEMPEYLSRLEESLSELERRLGSVLRLTEPNAEKGLTEARPALVDLAEAISEGNARIRSAHQRVVSILDRLEL